MKRLARFAALPAALLALPLLLAGCSSTQAPSAYSAVLYPSKQVQRDFFTAVDLDTETGEFVGVKHDFTPDDQQIAMVALLDQEHVIRHSEIFYELVAPGGFIVEVERRTYEANVPHGVFFDIGELVNAGRVIEDEEVIRTGFGEWQGNFYVDGETLGQVKFNIIDPDAPAEKKSDEDALNDFLFGEDYGDERVRESDMTTTTSDVAE